MSFGHNLQFLRRMHRGMTQEELAEKMGVSRQTISKWEVDSAFPEMEKAIALCELFSCSMDELLRRDMDLDNEAYLNMRVDLIPPFRYFRYAVISAEPEGDAIRHVCDWAASCGIACPDVIGWDFPVVSLEQVNVYHMHGYAAACVIPEDVSPTCTELVTTQAAQRYACVTIRDPFAAPFTLIPNAYQTLMRYIEVNGLAHRESKEVLPCFEKQYDRDGVAYMDVFIAVEP